MARKKKGLGLASPMREQREHHSVSVRKISNGFIVSTSHEKNGEYHPSVETYHPKKPVITLPVMPKTGTPKQMTGTMKKFI
jgi:hypothetical protein